MKECHSERRQINVLKELINKYSIIAINHHCYLSYRNRERGQNTLHSNRKPAALIKLIGCRICPNPILQEAFSTNVIYGSISSSNNGKIYDVHLVLFATCQMENVASIFNPQISFPPSLLLVNPVDPKDQAEPQPRRVSTGDGRVSSCWAVRGRHTCPDVAMDTQTPLSPID